MPRSSGLFDLKEPIHAFAVQPTIVLERDSECISSAMGKPYKAVTAEKMIGRIAYTNIGIHPKF